MNADDVATGKVSVPTGKVSVPSLTRLDPQALIAKAIDAGAGIETMERLFALAKDVREVQAREAWYSAMAEFQRQCPPIKKTATAKIHTARGSYTYHYAPLDEIVAVIQRVMGPLGLSVSWRSHRVESAHVVVSCRVAHMLGHHEESGEIAMPITQRGEADLSGANAAQRVGIAATYAKRYSLLGIIGMAPEDDDDAASLSQDGAGQAAMDEREQLLAHAKDLGDALGLKAPARAAAWATHVGQYDPTNAPIDGLRQLVEALSAQSKAGVK